MADEVSKEVAVRRGISAATTWALLALVVSIVAIVFALSAAHKANTAITTSNAQTRRVDQLETKINSSLGSDAKASSGTGVGPNTTNPTPNGNGQ